MLNIAQNILSYRQKILLMIGKIDRNKCSIFIGAGRDKKKKTSLETMNTITHSKGYMD